MLASGSICCTGAVYNIVMNSEGRFQHVPQAPGATMMRDGVLWKCSAETGWQWVQTAENTPPLFVNPLMK